MLIACSAVVTLLPPGVFITDDAAPGRRVDVDVVDADAGAADDAQPAWPRRPPARVTVRRAAHDQAVVLADDRAELFRLQSGALVDLQLPGVRGVLEHRHAFRGELVRNQNAVHGALTPAALPAVPPRRAPTPRPSSTGWPK